MNVNNGRNLSWAVVQFLRDHRFRTIDQITSPREVVDSPSYKDGFENTERWVSLHPISTLSA